METKIKSILYTPSKDATMGEVVSAIENLHNVAGCEFNLDGSVKVIFSD